MININGKTYTGSSVSISGNKVIIDGQDMTPDAKEINIQVTGDIAELNVAYSKSVSIKGNVHNVTSVSGDIEVEGNVLGNIRTASGDVDCGDVAGGISTNSGDIKHRKR